MPNINAPGSFLYPSGTETSSTVGSGATIALTSADINNPRTVMASGSYSVLQLPDVSSSSVYASGGTHFTGIVSEASYPIFVKNSGGQGLEPVLEKVLPPGVKFNFQLLSQQASGVYANYVYSASGANWAYSAEYPHTDFNSLKMLSRLNYNAADITGDFVNIASPNTRNAKQLIMLSSTLAALVFVDASGTVKAIPFQISTDGLTQASGAITQVKANGGNVLKLAYIQKCVGGNSPGVAVSPSGVALVGWWDNTNSLNGFAAITVTSGVSIPTLSVGGSGDDTTAVPASGNRIFTPGLMTGFTQDGPLTPNGTFGPNVWLAGVNKAATVNNTAYYITVSGTTPTLSAVLAYGGIETVTTNGVTGVALGSLVRGTAYGLSNRGNYLISLVASGGVITSGVAGAIGMFPNGSTANADQIALRADIVDANQNHLFLWTQVISSQGNTATTRGTVVKVNSATQSLMSVASLLALNSDGEGFNAYQTPIPVEALYCNVGEGEYLCLSITAGNGGTTYYDLKARNKPIPSLTSTSQGTLAAGIPPTHIAGFGAPIPFYGSPFLPINTPTTPQLSVPIAIDADKQSRRVGVVYTYSTNSTAYALSVPFSVGFFDFPKR